MTAIIPFEFSGSAIRTLLKKGDPWFVAEDLCRALEISKYRDAVARLDADERGAVKVDTLGGPQEVAAVNESGLYTLILRSRKATTPGTPQHRFRKWVTAEVLPSLRKFGSYGRARSVPQMLRLQNQSLKLLAKIKAEEDPASREFLHASLEEVMAALGRDCPSLERLVPPPPPEPPEAAEVVRFWEVFHALEANPETGVNHSRNPAIIAINLPHMFALAEAAGLSLPPRGLLLPALKAARSPRFLGLKAVNTRLEIRRGPRAATVKAWCFSAPDQSDADQQADTTPE